MWFDIHSSSILFSRIRFSIEIQQEFISEILSSFILLFVNSTKHELSTFSHSIILRLQSSIIGLLLLATITFSLLAYTRFV